MRLYTARIVLLEPSSFKLFLPGWGHVGWPAALMSHYCFSVYSHSHLTSQGRVCFTVCKLKPAEKAVLMRWNQQLQTCIAACNRLVSLPRAKGYSVEACQAQHD